MNKSCYTWFYIFVNRQKKLVVGLSTLQVFTISVKNYWQPAYTFCDKLVSTKIIIQCGLSTPR